MSHIPMILTIICTLLVSKSYLWHRPGSHTLMTTNPNLSDLSPCLTLRAPHTQPPIPCKEDFGLSSSLYTFTSLLCGHLAHCPGPTFDSCCLASTWPSWSQRELLQLSQALSNLVLPFPSLLEVHILPGPPVPALAWHLLLVSLYCCLSLRLLPKGDLKKSRLLFSAENLHWYLIVPEMSLKLLTVHISHSKARPLPQQYPFPLLWPWPLHCFTGRGSLLKGCQVTVLLWSGLI